MPSSGAPQGAWELNTMERRYSVPPGSHHRSSTGLAPHQQLGYHEPPSSGPPGPPGPPGAGHAGPQPPPRPHHHQRSHSGLAIPSNSEDLHAWSIYRQNLNSDFTDSALGSSEKSPLPYGNFQLRDSTVHSILSHPRYGPKSALGANMYTYLKFGLPRVFPPSASRGRDGSSGYDSSDDQGHPVPGGHGPRYGMRSRSDPDFRSHPQGHPPGPGHPQGHPAGHPAAHPSQPHPAHQPRPYSGARHGGRGEAWRAKSSSEANLLSPETIYRHEHRRSVHDLRGAEVRELRDLEHAGRRPMSKAGSHASLALSRRGLSAHSHLDDGAASKVTAMSDLGHPYYPGPGPSLGHGPGLPDLGHGAEGTPFPYPHLQVRGLEVESRRNKRQLLLQGVSLEVRGGELMAIMATSAEEGTALLDTLAGCPSRLAGRVHGDILLNGQCLPRRSLSNRVAYVRSERTLNPYLSVEQTLYFTNWLRQPGYQGAKTDTKDRVAALVEDLGLEQVRHTKVWSLTTSEQRRLAVAAQLLLDTDVLVLDRPTAGMDIFDTFFLVEFLRQWAGNAAGSVTGRAVVMTLHPPTYEIFTMLSRVALLSKGRLMFCGRRRDMLPYFASAEYPCPSYKNPSDYYLDLVTLDDLSAEAMLESSQRIEQLADVFRRREQPLSEPGAPAGLPPSVRSANVLKQAAALLVCWSVYAQPGALSRWLSHLVLAVGLSLFLGAVWWDVAASDPQLLLGDRVGYLYALLVVLPWPLLLLQALAGWGDTSWRAVADDIRDRLYGRLVFILCQIVYGLLPSAIVWAGYVVPAYTMTGLQNQATDPNAFYIYAGYSLLYLLALQSLLVALSAALRSRRAAGLAAGLVLLPLALLAGPLLHERDLEPWLQYAALASPMRWALPTLVRREYAPDVVAASVANIMCRNKQVQHQDIIVQLPCPPPNVTAALQYHGLGPSLDAAALALLGGPVPAAPAGPPGTVVTRAMAAGALWPEPGPLAWPAIALAAFWAAFAVLACLVFPLTALRHRARRRPTSHRP